MGTPKYNSPTKEPLSSGSPEPEHQSDRNDNQSASTTFQKAPVLVASARQLTVAQSIGDLVGGTPALRLNRLFPDHHVIAKLEFLNPLLSIKDRPAHHIIENIAQNNLLAPGGLLIVPTSGNFGLSVATYGRLYGYSVVVVMASDTSPMKRALLDRVCGRIVVCDGNLNSDELGGYVHTAREMAKNTSNSYVVDQFYNSLNPEAHYSTTGPELLQQMDGKIDIFFSIMGTGGTFSGISRYLMEHSPATRIVLVDVQGGIIKVSHDGGVPAWRDHPVSAISDNFIPPTADLSLADMVIEIPGESAFEFSRLARETEGLFVGASAGTVLSGIRAYITRYGLAKGTRVGCVLGDTSLAYGSDLCDNCPPYAHLEMPVLFPSTSGVLELNKHQRRAHSSKQHARCASEWSVILTSICTSTSESVLAKCATNGVEIATYVYEKGESFNAMGRCLIKGTLLAWAAVDLCFASTITIQLSENENTIAALETYIVDSFTLTTSTYERLFNLRKSELTFVRNITRGEKLEEALLDAEKYLLGFSGGKDSTLSLEIMAKAGVEADKFQVAYDDNPMAPDGRIRKEVQNIELFSAISPSVLTPVYKTFEHQEDDIHATILAPYTSEQHGKPATVALGLPWEVLHLLNDGSPDLVPSETAASLQILMTFARSVGLQGFRIASPIANLSSFGVYRLLAKWHGRESLSTFSSCWQENAEMPACGECTKCQRVRLVEETLFEGSTDRNTKDVPSYAKMFGSVFSQLLATHTALSEWNRLSDDVTASITEPRFSDVIAKAGFAPLDVVGLTLGLDILEKFE